MSKYVGACRTASHSRSLLAFFHHMVPQRGISKCVSVCMRVCMYYSESEQDQVSVIFSFLLMLSFADLQK